MKYKVAVITRTRNREVLLERAVESVHRQTMTDFVHVIINNAGDKKIIDRVLKKCAKNLLHQPIVIHNDKMLDMYASANKAIKSVESEFVSLHDDDDTWHPDFLKKTTEHMDKAGSMGTWAVTDHITERVTDKSIQVVSQARWQPESRELVLYKLCYHNYAPPIAFIYRRSAYERVGWYDEKLGPSGVADWDFALRFVRQYDVDFVDSPHALAFYHWRQGTQGTSANTYLSESDAQKLHDLNYLANKYFREDLEKGSFGLGYVFNYQRDEKQHRIELYTELEAIKEQFTEQIDEIKDGLNKAVTQLEEIIKQRTSMASMLTRTKQGITKPFRSPHKRKAE